MHSVINTEQPVCYEKKSFQENIFRHSWIKLKKISDFVVPGPGKLGNLLIRVFFIQIQYMISYFFTKNKKFLGHQLKPTQSPWSLQCLILKAQEASLWQCNDAQSRLYYSELVTNLALTWKKKVQHGRIDQRLCAQFFSVCIEQRVASLPEHQKHDT